MSHLYGHGDVTANQPIIDHAVGQVRWTTRRQLLEQAADLIDGDRNNTYGDPADDFVRIADLWNVYLRERFDVTLRLEPADIGLLMVLLKVARLMHTPDHADSYVDIAGYAACAYEITRGNR